MSDHRDKPNPDETWISDGTDVPGSHFDEKPTCPMAPDARKSASDASFETAAAFADLREGVRVPGYTIIRQIGKGGMGAVFLAEQDRPRRTVALKVIRADRVSEAARRRFEFEAEILARLQHPGIARIYEVGTFDFSDEVTPYFVMEYIAGAQPLTAYANAKKLDTRDRLELFAKVCDAVRHGHQKGVIHRDLKPANILVDETGEPRVIDFGVARAQDSQAVLATMATNDGQLVGTLQYMSPEQCGGGSDNIDVRTDVYALGIVLFQLLSGELPYDLSTLGLAEAVFVVTQDRTPSLTAIETRFKGDLAVITAKAMAKDKDDRYQSASELAADIRRYLENRPILARPIGPVGLLFRWMKRNKEFSTAIVSAAAILTITSAVLIGKIIVAEKKATANFLIASENLAAVRDSVGYVSDVFEFRDPDGNTLLREGKVDVAALLEDMEASIAANPPKRPSTEADFRELLGVGYMALRSIPKARTELTRVLDIREDEKPPNPAAIATAQHNLASVYYWDGDYQEARDLYEHAIATRRVLFGGDHADLATSLNGLAASMQKLGELDDAQTLFQASIAMRQRLFGQESPAIAASLNNLGNLLISQERYQDAEQSFRESLAMISNLRGHEAIETSYALHNLASCLMHLGEYEEARSLFSAALDIRIKLLNPGHIHVAASRLGLAHALLELENAPEAEPLASESLKSMQATLQNHDHPDITGAQFILARILVAQQKYSEAVTMVTASIAGARAAEPSMPRDLAERLALLGECEWHEQHTAPAETALLEAIDLLEELDNPQPLFDRVCTMLVDLYTSTGRQNDASRISAMLTNP